MCPLSFMGWRVVDKRFIMRGEPPLSLGFSTSIIKPTCNAKADGDPLETRRTAGLIRKTRE